MVHKIISKEAFDSLPQKYRSQVLKKFFSSYLKNNFTKYEYLHDVICELIAECKYPNEQVISDVVKLMHSLQIRSTKRYKDICNKARISRNKKKRSLTSVFKLIKGKNGYKLSQLSLNVFDKNIYKHKLKMVRNNTTLELDDYLRFFDIYKRYKKPIEFKDGKYQVLYPKSYQIKCCSCNNQIIIPRSFNISIENLFCIMCTINLEQGALYLHELVSNLDKKLEKNRKDNGKVLL